MRTHRRSWARSDPRPTAAEPDPRKPSDGPVDLTCPATSFLLDRLPPKGLKGPSSCFGVDGSGWKVRVGWFGAADLLSNQIAPDPHRPQMRRRRGSGASFVGDGVSRRWADGRSVPVPPRFRSSLTDHNVAGWPTHRTPVRHHRVATGGSPTLRTPTSRDRSVISASNRRRTFRRSREADAMPSVARIHPLRRGPKASS
jgi:hypothetical protein